jgi:hypothetical protein
MQLNERHVVATQNQGLETALADTARALSNLREWFESARALILFSNRALSWYLAGDSAVKLLASAASRGEAVWVAQ